MWNENDRPLVKRHLSVVGHSPDTVELRSGVWSPTSTTVSDDGRSGNLFTLVRGLDGSRTIAELAQSTGVDSADVLKLVDELDNLAVLERVRSTALDHYLDNAAQLLAGPAESMPVVLAGDDELTQGIRELLTPSVRDLDLCEQDDPAWVSLSDPDHGWLTDSLRLQERLEQFSAWAGHFLVVATKYPQPLLSHALNRVALRLRIPWLHATLDGPFLFVGPLILPHRTACFECFETRVTMNLRQSGDYLRYKEALADARVVMGTPPIEPALSGLLSAHTALEALNFLHTSSGFTAGKVLAIYLPTMEIAFHDVLRVPSCPACGSVSGRDDVELYFDPRSWLGSPNEGA